MQRRSAHAGRLSVVIAAADVVGLEDTLVSVLENRPHDCDIVVALGAPYDDPWNIRDEVAFVESPRGSGLVGCINAGVKQARGDVIHVLASGWLATEGWAEAALEHFTRHRVAAVVPLGVAEGDRSQPVSAGIRRTPGGRSVPLVPRLLDDRIVVRRPPAAPRLEAGFWRADLLREIGFTAACGDALAAADMAAALSVTSAEVVFEPACRIVAGPVRAAEGAFRAGLHAERLFWRSLPCESILPALVAHAGEVLRHAATTAPLGTVGTLVGRVMGLFEIGSTVARIGQLAALRSWSVEGHESPRTYRIDTAEEVVAEPHVAILRQPLRRSA